MNEFVIDYSMHKDNRDKLWKRMGKREGEGVLLKGGFEVPKYDTDTSHIFRQESFFQYLFGVREPDCYGFVSLSDGCSILFVPRRGAEYELWSGKNLSKKEFEIHYGVDQVHFVDEIGQVLKACGVGSLHILNGINTDSGLKTSLVPDFDSIESFILLREVLYAELVECRLRKSQKELNLMRFVNKMSSKAHIKVMQTIKPGMKEFHAECEFLYDCYKHSGARMVAYTCICGSGSNSSVLHYGHAAAPNDKVLGSGELLLNDMGGELHCYASDITCTIPIDGKFNEDQKLVYEAVLAAHDAVISSMQPGVCWRDMHYLSHEVLTKKLMEAGLFLGTFDELMNNRISCYFYPHGLGHLLGLDVHDVGGYLQGESRDNDVMYKYLRCNRVLEEGMVLTVEPGCYFIDAQIDLLSQSTSAKLVNMEMLKRFRGFGGVRIESDVIVLDSGVENMTKVPRTVSEIEAVMAGNPFQYD
jgi:Xaa-Pro dipeptidase